MKNKKKAPSALSEAIDIGLIDPEKADFYITEGNFTALRYNDNDYKRISLRRALPLGSPNCYISVADHENKEIGIIRDINELSGKQLDIVQAELGHRYFSPDICEIKSVKDKLGYVYLELVIETNGKRHDKSCAVKDVSKNIRVIDEDRLAVFDVDGNRYMVNSLSSLDKKSRKRLEPYMF